MNDQNSFHESSYSSFWETKKTIMLEFICVKWALTISIEPSSSCCVSEVVGSGWIKHFFVEAELSVGLRDASLMPFDNQIDEKRNGQTKE